MNPYNSYLQAGLNGGYLGLDQANAVCQMGLAFAQGITVASHAEVTVRPPRPLEQVWIACNRISISHDNAGTNDVKPDVLIFSERITVNGAL
mmetsp:Transcript_3878/g.4006  ORF Transcript_3878/g.4006 Transcript_3878/m.4006 type:complete len:92 (+) Transcript_3878:513-788(+)